MTIALVLLCSLASRAAAQDAPDERTLAIARELYEAGVRAAEAERWAEAEDAFERSHALSPTVPALANLATARLALAHYLDAREALRELVAHPDLPADRRPWAEEMLARASAAVARVRITGVEPDERPRVTIDGADVNVTDFSAPIELDPGEHTVTVVRPGEPERTLRAEFEEGRERVLHAARAAPPPAPERPLLEPIEAEPVTSEPAFWAALGVGLAVVGAGIAILAVALDAPDDFRLAPRTGVVLSL